MYTEGDLGAMPEDYPLFKAAQWMSVAPWELLKQSFYWKERALLFMSAENEAQALAQQQPWNS